MSFILGTSNDDTLTGTAGSDTIQGLNGFDDLSGGDGADTLFGGAGSDLLRGGPGNDFLYGGAGLDLAVYDTSTGPVTVNLATGLVTGPDGSDLLLSVEAIAGSAFADRLTGDAGENLLMGLGGNDTIDGGAGFDLAGYLFASTPVTVNLATGVVSGGGGFDTLIAIEGVLGSDLGDTLTGDGNANVFVGMEGNDTISGGGGADTASYEYAPSAVTVSLATGTSSGGDGADVLTSIENLVGSEFADTLTGDAGANYIVGGDGDDTLAGGLGNDTLEGGAGFNIADYHNTAGPVTVDLAHNSAVSVDGNDVLIGIDGVTGSEFDDHLTGDANLNWFTGRGGNDTIDGGDGPDWASYAQTSQAIVADLGAGSVIVAGGSHDTLLSIEAILGSSGNDSILGSAGGDSIEGFSGSDTLDGAGGVDLVVYRYATSAVTVNLANGVASGGDGADTLSNFEGIVGSLFSDTLTGDAKDNTFEGRSGGDTINGGDGSDTVTYANALSGVTVNLATGIVSGGDGGDRLTSIENAIGSASGDTIVGSIGANALSGLGGNDILEGGVGADTLDGGGGFDFASYANATGPMTVNLATGVVTGPDGGDTLIAMEAIIGSAFADTLTGDANLNFLRGGAGNDTLDGGDGNDFADYANASGAVQVNLGTGVVGGADGVDTLISIEYVRGSAFDDTLIGSAGANWIRGGAGNDTIDGGAGDDYLDFLNVNNGVFVDLAAGVAYGEASDRDTISNIEHVRGSNFDDWLIGDTGSNILRGGPGDDILDGGDGVDFADYTEATGGVTLDLAKGVADSPDGHDTLRRIEGAFGSAYADVMIGDAHDNVFQGGAGADTIIGGGGLDSARYIDASAPITANLATHVFTGAAAEDVLTGIEGIQATPFADTLVGDGADNVFRGNGGDDTIDGAGGTDIADYRNADSAVNVNLALGTATGGDGNDTLLRMEGVQGSMFDDSLTGDAGDNVLRGRAGNDTLDGGAGTDTAEFGSATAGVTANLSLGTTSGADGIDTLIRLENLTGSDYNDLLIGDGGANVLRGGAGDDSLSGLGGSDTAAYDGARAGYTVAKRGVNFVVTDLDGSEGTDVLNQMELIQFSDKTFSLANPPRTHAPDYGKDVGFLFDSVYYLLANPEKVPTLTVDTALADYFASGAAQHLKPNAWFDPSYYSAKWADLAPLHLDDATLFMHYNLYGVWEGRSAGPAFDHFDGNRYLTDWPDVAAYVDANLPAFLGSRTNGAIAHFIIYGANEQRTAYDTVGALIDMGYIV